jgi:Phorbol esters/diacylglycerol binding domain (C1 domain)
MSDVTYRVRNASSASINSSSRSSSATSLTGHKFEVTNFLRPTYCDLCSNFIWGIANQGSQCTTCGFSIHHKCKPLVKSHCDGAILTPPSSPKEQSSLVRTLYTATQEESKKLDQVLVDATPPLTLTRMLKNNNRFTARQKPMILVNETVIKLVTWHNPTRTCLFLCIYTIICS